MATIDGTLESSLHDTFEHVKDAHELGLLLRHVVREAVLHHELLQLALRPPQLGHSDRLFLHESASCITSDVREQQLHEKRPASSFLQTLRTSMCRQLAQHGEHGRDAAASTRRHEHEQRRGREREERGQVAVAAACGAAPAALTMINRCDARNLRQPRRCKYSQSARASAWPLCYRPLLRKGCRPSASVPKSP